MSRIIVDKILNIIKEDKNQSESILRYDLERLLNNEMHDAIEDAFEDGYTAGKNDRD